MSPARMASSTSSSSSTSLSSPSSPSLPSPHPACPSPHRPSPHQEEGHSGAQDEAGHHVGAVVPVLGDPVQSGEEGGAECPQAEDGLGQAARLGLDGAGDVHLEGDKKKGVSAPRRSTEALLHLANSTTLRTPTGSQSNALEPPLLEAQRSAGKEVMSNTYIIKTSNGKKGRNGPRGERRETPQRVWKPKNTSAL